MSVAYVQDHPTPVTVADELESFFHVTLFYAVRLLRTNLRNVEKFVVDYFDSYCSGVGRFGRVCGDTKTGIVRSGTLYAQNVQIKFYLNKEYENKNLNTVLSQWLRLFQARYAVREQERQPVEKHGSGSAETSFISGDPADDALLLPTRQRKQAGSTREETEAKDYAHNKEIAEGLDDHTEVMYILYDALMAKKPEVLWPDCDVIPDMFPETYDPRETLLAMDRLVAATSGVTARSVLPHKRARTQASSERPAAGSSKQVATGTGYPSPGMKPTGRNPWGTGRIAKSEPLNIAAHDDNPLGALGNGNVDGNR
ncbi:hypothetical protein C8Q78DRAFT_389308 [Trametes maxima]|nr:hypothetical protein C8Q78DRAFT_389308 [Trametes maxima]